MPTESQSLSSENAVARHDAVLSLVLAQVQAVCTAHSIGLVLLDAEHCLAPRHLIGGLWAGQEDILRELGAWVLQQDAPRQLAPGGDNYLSFPLPGPESVTLLILPIEQGRVQQGSLWIAAPGENPPWDGEQIRFLTHLGQFALAAVRLPLLEASVSLPPSPLAISFAESAQLFRTLYHESSLPMAIVGRDDHFMHVNDAFSQLVGYSEDELKHLSLAEITHPEDVPREIRLVNELFSNRHSSFQLEKRLVRRDGRAISVSQSCLPIHDAQGRLLFGLSLIQDVSAQRKAEAAIRQIQQELEQRVQQRTEMLRASNQALRESELRFRALFDQTFQFVGLLSLTGEIILMNQTALDFAGVSLDDIEGRPFWTTRWWERSHMDQEVLQAAIRRAAEGEFVRYEVEVSGVGERAAAIDFSLKPVQDDLGRATLLIFEGRDITERKKLQREVLQIAADEQRRIGQELHDGTGQALTGLGYLAQTLAETLAERNVPESVLAERVSRGLKESLKQVRELARGLIPVQVDAEGLMAALANLAQRSCEIYGLRCSFECQQPVPIGDNATATHLFRIAQEAVTNAAKHARCDEIVMRLQADPTAIWLSVEDNGIGMTPLTATAASGVGMHIMNYRASLIGAVVAVTPGPHGGTVVTCTLCKEKF